MTTPLPLALTTAEQRPTLICLSHLRWDFVFQRPQHLLSRAAKDFDVVFVEEALHTDDPVPGLRTGDRVEGVRVFQPTLPHSATHEEWIAHQRMIVEELVADARDRAVPVILWYYTPMALEFSDGVAADLVVFDKMDELSAFRNAPQRLLDFEQKLLTVPTSCSPAAPRCTAPQRTATPTSIASRRASTAPISRWRARSRSPTPGIRSTSPVRASGFSASSTSASMSSCWSRSRRSGPTGSS